MGRAQRPVHAFTAALIQPARWRVPWTGIGAVSWRAVDGRNLPGCCHAMPCHAKQGARGSHGQCGGPALRRRPAPRRRSGSPGTNVHRVHCEPHSIDAHHQIEVLPRPNSVQMSVVAALTGSCIGTKAAGAFAAWRVGVGGASGTTLPVRISAAYTQRR